MRPSRVLISLLAVALVTTVVVIVAASGGGDPAGASASRAGAPAALPGPIPERSKPVQAVEPAAGETGSEVVDQRAEEPPADSEPAKSADGGADLTRQRAMRIRREDDGGGTVGVDGGDVVRKAQVLNGGVALPPLEAPDEVRAIIESGNSIARTPYIWGGGHGKWLDKGYDCSGSVSFALASAGLLNAPLASGPFMKWGKAGRGKWITIYANPGHMFMVVAGVRFDTSGAKVTGSRWQNSMRTSGSFVARHPPGL